MPLPPLVRPERSAHAAIRGYIYQTCLGVLRWLDLKDDEILVVEGDEDLDRLLLDGTGVSEQVKAYTGRLGARDHAVRDSLRSFAVAYAAVRQDDADRRFIFATTAEKRRPRSGALDVVGAWDDPERRDDVIAELRKLLPKEDDKHVAEALAWFDAEPERWMGFVDAVEWKFEEPKLDEVRALIDERLRERGFRPTESHLDRLVAELLHASSQSDIADRRRTPQDLEDLLRSMDEELVRWSATPRAAHLRAVFDEVDEIHRLLHDGTRELRPDPSPGHLLTAAHEVVPFHTELRRKELDDLAEWCDNDARASVWLWTGEGGTGKTRLMIEWCRQLRAQGWHAGFLHRYLEDGVGRLAVGKAPRLVVIDYAETRQDVVRSLLYHAATALHGPCCRVVLLARREADWWRILRKDDADVEQLIGASPEPRQLAALDAGRAAAFRAAVAAFSEATEPGDDQTYAPELERAVLERVLYLHMAALASVGGERIEDASDALAKTLDHERRFWTRRIDDLVAEKTQRHLLRKAVPRAVAALTLTSGAAGDGATRLISAATEDLALRDDLRATLDELLLRPLYGDGIHLGGLEPDLLGEELVSSCLAVEPSLLGRVVEVADADGRASALTVLTRLARRRPAEGRWLTQAFEGHVEELAEIALTVAVDIGDPVGRVLAECMGGASEELAKRLMDRCDREDYQLSVSLREIACEATRRYQEVCSRNWPEPDEGQLRELSRVELHLGNRLSDLGRRKEALEQTRQAVEILRRLSDSHPNTYLHDLANGLTNLGVRLSAVGQSEEGLDVTREAVEILRQLCEVRPDAFLADLATSLNNLGIWLNGLGRCDEAFEATREGVEIDRGLSEANPDVFLPVLAVDLKNLGKMLSDLGLHEEAFEANLEAVGILRCLSEARPDAYLYDLAGGLNNLGGRLIGLGRSEEAIEVILEAVEILRQLSTSRPDVFLPDLAVSLNNLGKLLSALGQFEEAFRVTNEALQILAPFFERLPAAYSEWMRIFVANYRKRANESSRPVDSELLSPILKRLERLGEHG